MYCLAVLCFTVATTVAAPPAPPRVQMSLASEPVGVTDVRVFPSESVGNGDAIRRGELDISFHSGAPVAATDVLFDINDAAGNLISTSEITGSFAPMVSIERSLPFDSFATDVKVRLVRAVFADGTVWFDYSEFKPLRFRV